MDASGGWDGLRTRQRSQLLGMVNAMRPGAYKVLVVDDVARSLLDAAGLGTVAAWRCAAEKLSPQVTLILGISDRRHRLLGVPAVYFVEPNAENLVRIARDLSASLYHACEVHFTSTVPLPLLAGWVESISSQEPAVEALGRVEKVSDRFLSFKAERNDIFHLGMSNTYRLLYGTNSSDKAIQSCVAKVVEGVVSVLVTLKLIPIIRCQRGGPAELVAREVNSTVRDLLEKRRGLFLGDTTPMRSYRRPLLLILDRDVDLTSIVHHSWNYLSLLTNTVGLSDDGKVTVQSGDTNTTYTLQESDEFWAENQMKPFPKVAEAIEVSCAEYRKDFEKINSDVSRREDQVTTSKLAETISSLPEITKRKESLDMHTEIASAILDCIRLRGIDSYFELEGQLIAKGSFVDKHAVLTAISESEGTVHDKMALAVVYYMNTPDVSQTDANDLEAALERGKCDRRLLKFLTMRKPPSALARTVPRPSFSTAGTKRAFVRSVFSDVVDKGVKGLSQAALSVKEKIVQVQDASPASILLQGVMEGSHSTNKSLEGFDPKHWRGGEVRDQNAKTFDQAIVFVLGGGSHAEYQNILNHSEDKNVIYGTTDIPTSNAFVDQLLAVAESHEM